MKDICIYQIHIKNLRHSCFSGNLEEGTVGVITDRNPKFVFEKIGSYFIAEDSGFVKAYRFIRGTTDGFAGREIKLDVKGGTVFRNKGSHIESFKGSLWDCHTAAVEYEKKYRQKLFSIGQNSHIGHIGCPVFTSMLVTETRMKEIMENIKFKPLG